MIQFAGRANNVGVVGATGVAMALPRSFSVNSSSIRDDDRDYRELVRAASQRVHTTQIRITKLSDHQPFNRSLSTYTENSNRQQNSVGRIDEESPCYFSGSLKKTVDEDLQFPRSRSCSSVENLNLEKKIKIIM
uniref:Uncharacterized protein n=1 Tax=Picea sitchensis TaxID=3332 RepID=A9NXE7_PICSI|nr:unknown [Picea sitchensis]